MSNNKYNNIWDTISKKSIDPWCASNDEYSDDQLTTRKQKRTRREGSETPNWTLPNNEYTQATQQQTRVRTESSRRGTDTMAASKLVAFKSGQNYSHDQVNSYPKADNNIECVICTDTFDRQNFKRITSQCTHKNNVCINCVRRHIKFELGNKGNFNIKCPLSSGGCLGILQELEMRKFANQEDFEKFQKFSVNSALSQIKEFQWCSNPQCDSGQIHEGGEEMPIMTCAVCHQKSCVIHNFPIRNGLSCVKCQSTTLAQRNVKKQRLKDLRNEIKSLNFIKAETRPCPKCTRRIQKTDGCDHMKCSVGCQHEFCWLCFADFEPIRNDGNHRHQSFCKHYRPYP